jgi:hypothetical protein
MFGSAEMKKITVALEDEVYLQLIDYVAARTKTLKSRLSVSESASELISRGLLVAANRGEAEDGG